VACKAAARLSLTDWAILRILQALDQWEISLMRIAAFSGLLALTLAAPVTAQDAAAPYSVDQLVEFFANSADLGATRGICIGTPQECAPPKPEGLDMLVTFELDSADLTPQAQEYLALFAQMMQDDRLKVARFVVEGHTDARGTDAYNAELSESRADAVRRHLVGLGVAEERLSSIGLGKDQPRTGDAFDPENRRVELRIDLN
jgi:outer membrane protein OmpA-like peptidoglycan-associated protein